MVREYVACLVFASLGGCSLVLDFSESAVPGDASIDAPYTQEECDFMEPNDSIEAAMVFTPADVGPAAICAGASEDRDFYKFTVPAGTASVNVRITFENRPTGDLDLRISDLTGAPQGRSTGFGNEEIVACPGASPPCPALAEGDYVFEVFPAIEGSVNRYDIALTITPM